VINIQGIWFFFLRVHIPIVVCSKKFQKCYSVILKATNWNQARLECWTRNMSLVTMLSLSEMRFIKYLLRERRRVDVPPTKYFDAEYYVHIGKYVFKMYTCPFFQCLPILNVFHFIFIWRSSIVLSFAYCATNNYEKQIQQGKAAFNVHNPHTTKQQKPVTRSLGGPQTKTGQGTRQSIDRPITKMIHKKK
jgi:hypothetical protein